jgi:putative heme transporter
MATATRADSPPRSTAPAPAPLVAYAVEAGPRVGAVPARDPKLARCIRGGASLVTVAAFALLVAGRRGALGRSLGHLGHSHWTWVPVAIGLELASMAAFALMQGRLLRAGGKRLGHRPMMATTLASNALSVSVPMAGPELGTAFTFRRFKTQGAPTALASWCLLVGGLVSWIGAIVVLVAGGALSGNDVVALLALLAAVVVVVAGVALRRALTRPQLPPRLERALAWSVGRTSRLLHHPMEDPTGAIKRWLDDLRSLRLPASEWGKVGGLALTNWLADAGVLAMSLLAIGVPVPWHSLLLIYGLATAVGSLGITPGGIGLVEGTLCLGLVSTGLPAALVLAAVLLYRLVSFWLVMVAGWLVLLYLRLERPARAVSIKGSVAL